MIGTYPGETSELCLVATGELAVYRRKRRLLLRELFVEVARVRASVLEACKQRVKHGMSELLTMVGKYGGGMRLLRTSSKLTSLKNG